MKLALTLMLAFKNIYVYLWQIGNKCYLFLSFNVTNMFHKIQFYHQENSLTFYNCDTILFNVYPKYSK